MTIHDQQNDRRGNYERLADPSLYRDRPPEEGERRTFPALQAGERTEGPEAPPKETDDARYDEATTHPEDAEHYAETRVRERFGGVNWGAGFFGWLVSVAMTVILTGLVGAIVGVLDRTVTSFPSPADLEPRLLAIVAAALVVLVLMGAYFTGGYVAGRMSRFDGGKQGAGVWVTGVLLSALVVGAGLVFGWQYDMIDRIDVPALPLPIEAVGIGVAGTAVAVLVGTLLAAVGGGRVGRGYHRKVDDYLYEEDPDRW